MSSIGCVQAAWRPGGCCCSAAGAATSASADVARRLGTAAGLAARTRGQGRVAIMAHGPLQDEATVRALAEGLTLAAFHVDAYKTRDRKLADLHAGAIVVATDDTAGLAGAVALGSVLGEAANVARWGCSPAA